MDNKNVFVAIALSMSVLLFWGAFFETPRKPIDQKNNQNVERKNEQNSITPTIRQPQIVKKLTREESISNSKRLKIENDLFKHRIIRWATRKTVEFSLYIFEIIFNNSTIFLSKNGWELIKELRERY